MSNFKPTARDVVVGLAATVIGSFSSYRIQEMSLAQQRVQLEQSATQARATLESEYQAKMQELDKDQEMKEEELEAQQKETAQQLDDEHQSQMLKRMDDDLAANRKLAATANRQYFSIGITNQCDELVNVALAYTALDGSLTVTGWLSVKPGQSLPLVDANTTNRTFYYYAFSKSHQWDDATGWYFQVSDYRFSYVEDTYFDKGWLTLPGNTRGVYFSRSEIASNTPFGFYALPLSCPKPGS